MRSGVSDLHMLILALGVCTPAAAQSWTQLNPTGAPPIGRAHAATGYDAASNQMIVFGGRNNFGGNLNDVWRLTNANGIGTPAWTQIATSGGPPAPRFGVRGAYDPGSNRFIVFGGGLGGSSPCSNDAWVLTNANGTGGTPVWAQLAPVGSLPGVRFLFNHGYNPATNRFVVWGGSNCFNLGEYGDLWVLANANGLGGTPTWTQLSPSGSGPAPIASAPGAYDPVTNRLTIWAPAGAYVLSNADGTSGTPTWSQLAPSGTAPAYRTGGSAVFGSGNNRMTLFGGNFFTLFNDVWNLDGANGTGIPSWSQVGPLSPAPAQRTGNIALLDAATGRMTIFGGTTGPVDYNDVWTLATGTLYKVCLLYDPTRAVRSGATYPIKLQLCDTSGANLSSPNILLHAAGIQMSSTMVSSDVDDAGNANPDSEFRYDAALGGTGGYIFNLKTTGLQTGTYDLHFSVTGDPGSYSVQFQVK